MYRFLLLRRCYYEADLIYYNNLNYDMITKGTSVNTFTDVKASKGDLRDGKRKCMEHI